MNFILGWIVFVSIVLINGLIGLSIMPRLRYYVLVKASDRSMWFKYLPLLYKILLIMLMPGDSFKIILNTESLDSYQVSPFCVYLEHQNYESFRNNISDHWIEKYLMFLFGFPFYILMLFVIAPFGFLILGLVYLFVLCLNKLCGVVKNLDKKTLSNKF